MQKTDFLGTTSVDPAALPYWLTDPEPQPGDVHGYGPDGMARWMEYRRDEQPQGSTDWGALDALLVEYRRRAAVAR